MQILLLTSLITVLLVWVTYLRMKMSSVEQKTTAVIDEINTSLTYCRSNHDIAKKMLERVKTLSAENDCYTRLLTNGEPSEQQFEQLAKLIQLLFMLNEDKTLEDLDEALDISAFGLDQVAELVTELNKLNQPVQTKLNQIDLKENLRQALLSLKDSQSPHYA